MTRCWPPVRAREAVLLGHSRVPVLRSAGRIRAGVSVDANACTCRSLRAWSRSTPAVAADTMLSLSPPSRPRQREDGEVVMAGPLLETKFHVPRRGRGLVPRPRLIEGLTRRAESALTLVSAPAGFGKTTLLTEW